jgi:glycosyltransferase involved in cell wall biosynthesis
MRVPIEGIKHLTGMGLTMDRALSLVSPLRPRFALDDKPLTVALVCTQRLWHGGEEQAALLAAGLKQRGHRCKVLARHSSEFASRMTERGFDVAPFSGRGRTPQGLWQIRRWLHAWRPDVLHFNDPHALTAAGIASLGLPIPLRVAARRVDFPLVSVARYQRLCDAIVCVSQAVRRVCQAAGVPDDRLHVVADGVDPERLQQRDRSRGRRSLGIGPETCVLLTVAKLTSHKGHRFMLEALPPVVRRRPDTVWVIAGDGALWDSLQQQTRRLNLQRHVRFLGYRRDIPDLIAAADLMVVPSQLEGLCSSIVDAMLSGLPVVATRAGGIPDLLAPSDRHAQAAGWLVPPRDPPALAKAVIDALQFPHVTGSYREAARQRAGNELTAARMVERTIDVYRQALAKRMALARAS